MFLRYQPFILMCVCIWEEDAGAQPAAGAARGHLKKDRLELRASTKLG